jgi:BirA family transcriptional regulator, biotin operon repressor / biotin---[acetyl-CoA-carboxylase] ligase
MGAMPAGLGATALPPLDAGRLRSLLTGPGRFWSDLEVVERTGSTNQDLLARAHEGAPQGLVLAAEEQLAGRGRQGRNWQSLPGAALTFSVLLRPAAVPPVVRGWLPLLAGLATATAVGKVTGIDVRLKWPNDVLVDGAKLAGILAEQSDGAIVVGTGLNVLGRPGELPVPTATSLEQHGASLAGFDRTGLLAQILSELAVAYQGWCQSAGDPDASGLRAAYLERCDTIGRQVKVTLPGGKLLTGIAAGVDGFGCLQVGSGGAAGLIAVSAGDVIHVR